MKNGTQVFTRMYVVYSYQYNDMKKPKVGARRFERLQGGLTTVDTLPPTVRQIAYVDAPNAADAIDYARAMKKITD